MASVLILLFGFFKILLLPMVLLSIVLLICIFFWKKRFSRWLLIITLVGLYFCANGVVPARLNLFLEQNITPITSAEIQQHHALVVLGAGISVSPFAVEPSVFSYPRIVKAASIYHRAEKMGITYTVFASGGITSSAPISEAMQIKQQLISLGVPSAQIITEDQSKNTFDNARYLQPLLKKYDIPSVLLVTDSSHMPRALVDFKHFGLVAVPAPSNYFWPRISLFPSSYNLSMTRLAIHEICGMWEFKLYRWLEKN